MVHVGGTSSATARSEERENERQESLSCSKKLSQPLAGRQAG